VAKRCGHKCEAPRFAPATQGDAHAEETNQARDYIAGTDAAHAWEHNMLDWFTESLELQRRGGKYVLAFVGLCLFFASGGAAYGIASKAASMFGFADNPDAVMYLRLGIFMFFYIGTGIIYHLWYTRHEEK
jgi:hypothetical protein